MYILNYYGYKLNIDSVRLIEINLIRESTLTVYDVTLKMSWRLHVWNKVGRCPLGCPAWWRALSSLWICHNFVCSGAPTHILANHTNQVHHWCIYTCKVVLPVEKSLNCYKYNRKRLIFPDLLSFIYSFVHNCRQLFVNSCVTTVHAPSKICVFELIWPQWTQLYRCVVTVSLQSLLRS